MAVVSLLVWLYTQHWRLDDLIFIALWMACVVAGITYSRRGGWGVVFALSAGAIVPVAGFFAYHLYLRFVQRMVVQTEAFYPFVLLVSAYGAALSAALVVGAFAAYDRQSLALRRWIKVGTALSLITVAVLIVGLGIRHHDQSWHPILTIPVDGIDRNRPAPPPMAFTPDGSVLAIVSTSPDGQAKQLRIWNLSSARSSRDKTCTSRKCKPFALRLTAGESPSCIHVESRFMTRRREALSNRSRQ